MRLQNILPICLLLLAAACTYTLKIKDGRTAYERKQFDTAVPMLQKEYANAKSRVEKGQLAFLLAEAYRRTGRAEQSLEWYSTANQNNYGPEALKGYAYALKKLERYKEAGEAFKNLGIEIGSPYEYRKEISTCKIVMDWQKETPTNGWTIAPAPFNSTDNDFSPVFFSDGRLLFTSDRTAGSGEEKYKWTGNKFMDIFIVSPEEASAQSFDNQLNTDGNEGVPCFNTTFSEMFFSRAVGAYQGDDAYNKIFVSRKESEAWGSPQPLPFLKEKVNYLHPALSSDGNTLLYASNDPEGLGGYDLYFVQRNPKSESGWDEPRMLSRSINTTGNELFPTFDADTLYFASDGLTGMGGLDIFSTVRLEKNTWAPPLNLKSPINSGSDDFGLVVEKRKANAKPVLKPGDLIKSGFVTSNRKHADGRGGDDIFRFEQRVPPPKPPKIDTIPTNTKSLVYKLRLEGYVLEKIFSTAGDPNSGLLGRKPLAEAVVSYEIAGKKQRVTVGEDGFFKLDLAENTDYVFSAAKEGYWANSTKFSTKGIAKDPANPIQTFEIEIVLDKIYRDKEITLENIYYDYDKWDIRPDAEPTLNRLAEVLQQNPAIKITLGSHTDCRGNDAYNQTLSQRRAQSAVNYLIGKGIDADRLGAVGYGESQPAVGCNCVKCTETEHQANRRTTFRVRD